MRRPMKSDSCRRRGYCKCRNTCDRHSGLKVIEKHLSFNGSRAFGLGTAGSGGSSSVAVGGNLEG